MGNDDEKLIRLFAELRLKKIDPPHWASKVLEYGFDSRALRMLASMNSSDSPVEMDFYLNKSFQELNWPEINTDENLMLYAKLLAKDIVGGKTDTIEGASELFSIMRELDWPSELYGLYSIDEAIWDYRRFLETGETSYFFSSKEQLDQDIIDFANTLSVS